MRHNPLYQGFFEYTSLPSVKKDPYLICDYFGVCPKCFEVVKPTLLVSEAVVSHTGRTDTVFSWDLPCECGWNGDDPNDLEWDEEVIRDGKRDLNIARLNELVKNQQTFITIKDSVIIKDSVVYKSTINGEKHSEE